MIRLFRFATAALVVIGLSSANTSAWGASFTNSFSAGGVWNTVFAQGFSPALGPIPDPGLPFGDFVSLKQFQFFKSGTADLIGTETGPASVQLAILNNIYGDLTNLSATSQIVVGLSTNTVTSTASLALGAPITFNFEGLPLRYGSSFGAAVVSNNNGVLAPVRISALTANYTDVGGGDFHPSANYGGEGDFQWSTSNFINTNEFGSFFFGFSYGGDANFSASLKRYLRGDFNGDDHFDAGDIPVMLQAAADLNVYRATNGLSAADLLTLADFDSDLAVTNVDIQGMLDSLLVGGGSLAAVPEPASILLVFEFGALCAFYHAHARRRSEGWRKSDQS